MGGLKPTQQEPPAGVDSELFQYLHSLLQQAEAASGSPELELRSKIEALRAETQKVPNVSANELKEVDVASTLDQLSAKMESVDKMLKEVEGDPEAKNFLSGSAELWMPVITASAEERKATSSSSTSSTSKDETGSISNNRGGT